MRPRIADLIGQLRKPAIISGHQHSSSAFISGHQHSSSAFISGHQHSSVVISIHQWTAKEASGHQRSSSHHMITWWQSAFISGHQHSSAVIISPYDHMVAISGTPAQSP
jgi:hypothetical protein